MPILSTYWISMEQMRWSSGAKSRSASPAKWCTARRCLPWLVWIWRLTPWIWGWRAWHFRWLRCWWISWGGCPMWDGIQWASERMAMDWSAFLSALDEANMDMKRTAMMSTIISDSFGFLPRSPPFSNSKNNQITDQGTSLVKTR